MVTAIFGMKTNSNKIIYAILLIAENISLVFLLYKPIERYSTNYFIFKIFRFFHFINRSLIKCIFVVYKQIVGYSTCYLVSKVFNFYKSTCIYIVLLNKSKVQLCRFLHSLHPYLRMRVNICQHCVYRHYLCFCSISCKHDYETKLSCSDFIFHTFSYFLYQHTWLLFTR